MPEKYKPGEMGPYVPLENELQVQDEVAPEEEVAELTEEIKDGDK